MSQSLFALNWTSSINNQCLPEDENSYDYEGLFTFHVKNLVDKLTTVAGWEVLSCSYWNTSSNEYRTASNLNKWETLNNIKFPTTMVTGSFLDSNGKTKYDMVSGAYTPSEHPWILLKHTRSMDYYGQSNNYMVIDCRYPLPPHAPNVGLVYDAESNLINDTLDSKYAKKLVLGTSSIKKQYFKANITKKNGKREVSVPTDVQVFPLTQDLSSFNGLAERDEDTSRTFAPVTGDSLQDYNSRTVAFVDILYSTKLPYSGTTSARPLTNKIQNISSLKTFDNKTVYTCWGFDNIDSNASVKTPKDKADDKYHFHYDPSNGVFIYQLTNKSTNYSNFTSMCGFVKIANYHNKDLMPYTTITLNTDPDFSKNTICFNNATGKQIMALYATNAADLKKKYDALLLTDKAKLANTFYNTCFRNYTFSDGIGYKQLGNTKTIYDPTDLPCYVSISPSDSALYVRQQESIKVMIPPDDDTLKIPLVATDIYQNQKNFNTTSDKIKFSTVESTNIINDGPYGTSGQYQMAFPLATGILTASYDVYVQTPDSNVDYKLLSAKTPGSLTTVKSNLVASKAALASTATDETYFGIQNATTPGTYTGAKATTLTVFTITNAPLAERWVDINPLMGTYLANNSTNLELLPSAITASFDSKVLDRPLPSTISTSSFAAAYINGEGESKYIKAYVGYINKGYFYGCMQKDADKATIGESSNFIYDDFSADGYFKQFSETTKKPYTSAEYNKNYFVDTEYLKIFMNYLSGKPIEAVEALSRAEGGTVAGGSAQTRKITVTQTDGAFKFTLERTGGSALVAPPAPTAPPAVSSAAYRAVQLQTGIPDRTKMTNAIYNKYMMKTLLTAAVNDYLVSNISADVSVADAISWYSSLDNQVSPISKASLVGSRIPLPTAGVPCYIKIPLNDLYENGVYVNSEAGIVAYDITSSATYKNYWKNDTPSSIVYRSQLNGASAFTVFKTLSGVGDTQLVALNYSLNEDVNTPIKNASVFGLTSDNATVSEDEKKILLSNGTKNTSDATFSEMPIFLLSLNPNGPEMKGYISDIFWGPNGVANGSMVTNTSAGPNRKTYAKLYWNGWWLPWVADDAPDWG